MMEPGQAQGEQGPPSGDQGPPPEAINACVAVLMMLAKGGGPNQEIYVKALDAIKQDVGGGEQEDEAQPMPNANVQAGGNPDARPMG
jgi:hypothetical protein